MKRMIFLIWVIIFIIVPLIFQAQPTIYSVVEVYTDPDIVDGSEITVAGYYTSPDYNYLLNFYGDLLKNRPFDPHTVIVLEGLTPPAEAWNGGFILAKGIVTYLDVPEPFYPEDSLKAYLNVTEISVILRGGKAPSRAVYNQQYFREGGAVSPDYRILEDCDSCKFAFLLSGGIEDGQNYLKYWLSLAALYNFKVNSQGYCPSNVFVHYFDGIPRDDDEIPAGRVKAADSTQIERTFDTIASRVAKCNRKGKPATFQKLVSNHGVSNGDIALFGDARLKPEHLKDLQQKVIDSCCRTVYDEFLQCYAGYVVDELSSLDNKSKATIYINSDADNTSSFSEDSIVDPYLQTKISSLTDGASYPEAVVNAKLAYDELLQSWVDDCHEQLRLWRAIRRRAAEQVDLWEDDSTEMANSICHSRNVTIVPFTHYCQDQEFVVPPGGQMVVRFSGNEDDCGNVTVSRTDDTICIGPMRIYEWNWNHPGSQGYVPGNQRRVVNGYSDRSTTFRIHNDNDTSRLQVEVLGSHVYPESGFDTITYPGFNFGFQNSSSDEFGPIILPHYFIADIDSTPRCLNTLPAMLGPGGVQHLEFTFQIDPDDPGWSQMELLLYVNEVSSSGTLQILSPASDVEEVFLDVFEPGQYGVVLGDFTQDGTIEQGSISLVTSSDLEFSLDCWGLKSSVPTTALATTWHGEYSTDWNNPLNWSDGVPGYNHTVIITPGEFQPFIESDIVIKRITVQEGANVITAPGAYMIVWGD